MLPIKDAMAVCCDNPFVTIFIILFNITNIIELKEDGYSNRILSNPGDRTYFMHVFLYFLMF